MLSLKDWKNDIVKFAETEYILPETEKPIKLMEHQKRVLRDCFTRDKKGKFPYDTVIYSAPKKSGKSEIGGIVGLWFSLTESRYNEVYYVANDLEQSQSRGFKRVCSVIRTNTAFFKGIEPTKNTIKLPNFTEITALASDYAGVAGANPGLTVWDELWGYSSEGSRRLYDELMPVPTRLNSLRFIVTYAGFEGESELLWAVYQKGLEGKRIYEDMPVWVNGKLYMYWDTVCRMPWQTPEFLEDRRRNERPNAYRRLFQNEWVSATTSFIPIESWDGCVRQDISPAIPPLPQPLFVGVDIGTKRDTTAVVSVYWDKDKKKIRLANHFVWQPSRAEPLDFEKTIEQYLLELHKRFQIGMVYYDPSQFVRSSQLLAGAGIPLKEYLQVPTNLTSMTQILYELIRGRNLEMYPSLELRKQNMDCVIIESGRGMRIAKEKASQKIDAIVALAMACQAAWDGAGLVPLPDSQPECWSKWDCGSGGSPSLVTTDDDSRISRWRI